MQSITLKTIAEKAGVSVMTVSRALRNAPRISTKRRKEILELARRLGYRPNPLVTALIVSRKRRVPGGVTLAWIDGKDDLSWFDQQPSAPIVHQTMAGIRDRAEELGFHFERFNVGKSGHSQKAINRILISRGIKGVVFYSGEDSFRSLTLDWEHFACVKLCSDFPSAPFHEVLSNPIKSTSVILDKLRDYGYEKIGLAIPRADDLTVDNLVSSTYMYYQSGLPACRRMPVFSPMLSFGKDRKPGDMYHWYCRYRPDAIVAFDFYYERDLVPFGVKIPDDVAWAQLTMPKADSRLAGTIPHKEEIGRAAVDLLAQMIYTNSYGIPAISQKVLVACAEWVDGPTAPRKKRLNAAARRSKP